MQDLRVIGVENGALLVASDDGERYRIPIDEVMQSRLRQALPEPGAGRKLSPRIIQGHIRSGMSAEEVTELTGVPLDYIRKFEGPVLAEREFVVETALGVPVHTAAEIDPAAPANTFGAVISHRLQGLGATDERWASWKEEETGWIVKLSFTSDEIDHDARWRFDPKKLALSPINGEAITLSQQGDTPGALIPRLRAVSGIDREADSSRFDSGAFDIDDLALEPVASALPRFGQRTQPQEPVEHNQTADLLEALRRRRGERELPAYSDAENAEPGFSDEDVAAHPSAGNGYPSEKGTRGIRVLDIPLDVPIDGVSDDAAAEPERPASPLSRPQSGLPHTGQQPRVRKGRASMPSWDDIVFGARSDDDLA